MADKRDRFIKLVEYIEDSGVIVNIGKNRARGNKGLFLSKNNKFRIDISKNVDNAGVLQILLHEFAHYIHYKYDKSMKSLDFVFGNLSDEELDELCSITVYQIPKEFAGAMYEMKNTLNTECKALSGNIKKQYPNFKSSEKFAAIEKKLPLPVKYLLKYDNVRFMNKVYSVNNLEQDFAELSPVQTAYIKLRAKQRMLSRINSKISRLNRYYNRPSEQWARFTELFFTDKDTAKRIAPKLSEKFYKTVEKHKIPEINMVERILTEM